MKVGGLFTFRLPLDTTVALYSVPDGTSILLPELTCDTNAAFTNKTQSKVYG